MLLGEKHRTCARIATSSELRADPTHTLLHYLPRRPAPPASQPLSHIVRHRRRLPCRQSARGYAASELVGLRCVVDTHILYPSRPCPPRSNLLCCFRRYSSVTKRWLVGGGSAPCRSTLWWRRVDVSLGHPPLSHPA